MALRNCIGFNPEAQLLHTSVSQRQFVAMAASQPSPGLLRLITRVAEWREAFRMFDKDTSGDLSADELADFSTKARINCLSAKCESLSRLLVLGGAAIEWVA